MFRNSMDEDVIDGVHPRRNRPKDTFQNELQERLKQRKNLGLVADVTDSDEEHDHLGSMSYKTARAGRPGSAKRRPEKSPELNRGMGTTTMGSRDLTRLLGRSLSDDDDEEIVAANLGRTSAGGQKTPSPQQSKFLRKKEPAKDHKLDSITGKKTPTRDGSPLDALFGRKTPTIDSSPRSAQSKQDIIFARKTPTMDGKRSPNESRLPGMDGDRQWQPPSYRNVSPSPSTEHSRGSRGGTPVDSALDTISETPREKVTPRMQRGAGLKQTSFEEKPKPQARGKFGERKTPPLAEPRRKSPTYQTEKESALKRSTPTLDLFGSSRTAAAKEVDEYIGDDKKKDPRHLGGRKTPEGKRGTWDSRGKSPERPGSAKFTKDARKTPTGVKGSATSPGLGRKSPFDKRAKEEEVKEEKKPTQQASLLDFLMEDSAPATKPKPQERSRRPRGKENEYVDDMFANTKKPSLRSQSFDGRKSPGLGGRKTPDHLRKSQEVSQEQLSSQKVPKQQSAEDTSSLCEEIPPDPNRQFKKDQERAMKSGKQTSERAKADNVINTIAGAQTMQYIEPAKKMRPVTASAKVQHRPKPRYGTLPGNNTMSLTERQFNSTGDIREAIYEEWYKERIRAAKLKKKEEERKKKEEEDKKKKEEEEKRMENMQTYMSWMKQKEEMLQSQKQQKQEERTKKKKEKIEKEEKKEDADKQFELWKEAKRKQIQKETQKKKEEEARESQAKKDKEQEEKREKESAHRAWCEKKNRDLAKQVQEKKREMKNKTQKQLDEERELRQKEEDALDRYYEWLEKKERQAKVEKNKTKQRRMMEEEEYKPAWSPASRTVPFGR